ncbi:MULTISPECIES: hypothetical protein [unclassified Bradyrhizobium]|uniref:hypothetical protein n=1 Tax=unclassified Bradyrhizobium TaxID=2631580 RepID=UPI001BCF1C93|nr:hypothetical protein [Bradyrhizobium sp. sBnM-33]
MRLAVCLRNRNPGARDIAIGCQSETRDDRLNLCLVTQPRLQFLGGAIDRR